MALSLQNRRIGDVIVVACAGRIVAGDEASQLEKHLFALLPDNPFLILNLHDIHYVDSGGVGLLVRLLNRARTARGDLKLCDVSERVREVLKITRLDRVFAVHASEPEAIAGFLHQAPATADSNRLEFDILYVDPSPDVLAYSGEVLKQAGYSVMAFDNLPDALMLLKGSRPKLVVMAAELRSSRGTWTADKFNALANQASVIELPSDMGRKDAADAGSRLLDQVRAVLGARAPGATPGNPAR